MEGPTSWLVMIILFLLLYAGDLTRKDFNLSRKVSPGAYKELTGGDSSFSIFIKSLVNKFLLNLTKIRERYANNQTWL